MKNKKENEEKEKGQISAKVFFSYKKCIPKQDIHHHSSLSYQVKSK